MVSLKRTPKEIKEEKADTWEPSLYPVSTYICDDDMIEKLGLKDANVGDEFTMTSLVRVTSKSADEMPRDADGDTQEQRLTLTFKEAQVSPAEKKVDAGAMYPSMKK